MTSRPTICLVNFVLSGKPVLLEQPRKGAQKLISHVLMSHAGMLSSVWCGNYHTCLLLTGSGSIYLHCIPSTRSHMEDPPSISEGWGGRITDYRISVSATHFASLYITHSLLCRISANWWQTTCSTPYQRTELKSHTSSLSTEVCICLLPSLLLPSSAYMMVVCGLLSLQPWLG